MATKIVKTLKFPNSLDEYQINAVKLGGKTLEQIEANNSTLPEAGSTLGGVKSGGDVTIASGVITVNDDSHNHVISNVDGLQNALNGKANDFSIEIYNGTAGNPKPVRFASFNYSTCTSEEGIAAKISLVSGHGNGSSYAFLEDAIIRVTHLGGVEVDNFKYYGADTDTYDGARQQYGDIFWVHDETNKIVDFYVLMGQYARVQQTPWKRLTYSSKGTVTQYTSCTVYSSGTKAWANNSEIALVSDISTIANNTTYTLTKSGSTITLTGSDGSTTSVTDADTKYTLATVATSGSYNDLTSKPTIPTVNNATLTIKKNGTNVATFTANSATNATANITVPTGAAADKGVDTSISAASTSTNLPTSKAVAAFVEGKGYKTTDNNYYHTTGSWNGLKYTANANGGAGELSFTIPTGKTSTSVAVGNHTHTTDNLDGGTQTWTFYCGNATTVI